MKGRTVISRVTFATIVVRDLEAALEFYTNTLGFEKISYTHTISETPGLLPPPSVEVSPAGAEIVIALRTPRQGREFELPYDRDFRNAGRPRKKGRTKAIRLEELPYDVREAVKAQDHRDMIDQMRAWAVLALHTDDLLADYRELTSRGVHFIRDPDYCERTQRLICAAFLDQDGNVIVLEQQLEEGDPGPIELDVEYDEALPP